MCRLKEFCELFQSDVIDLGKLRKLAFAGESTDADVIGIATGTATGTATATEADTGIDCQW